MGVGRGEDRRLKPPLLLTSRGRRLLLTAVGRRGLVAGGWSPGTDKKEAAAAQGAHGGFGGGAW